MRYKSALILVENIQISRDFYETVLSQKVVGDYGEDVAFEGFSIHLREHFENLVGVKSVKNAKCIELYFESDDLDQVQKALSENGVAFLHPIIEQPWKQCAIRVLDPDGYIVEIGESFEHMAYRLFKLGYAKDDVMKFSFFTREKLDSIINARENP